ncbi:hypothetical protein J3459_015984 [Metarhizium acridum]|nr:hypothetical protein J3459_015984 [Metarhizium acridum]
MCCGQLVVSLCEVLLVDTAIQRAKNGTALLDLHDAPWSGFFIPFGRLIGRLPSRIWMGIGTGSASAPYCTAARRCRQDVGEKCRVARKETTDQGPERTRNTNSRTSFITSRVQNKKIPQQKAVPIRAFSVNGSRCGTFR